MNKYVLLICTVLGFAATVCRAHDFELWGNVPLNPDKAFVDRMVAMGVTRAWAYCPSGLPVVLSPDGKPEWRDMVAREQIIGTMDKVEGSGMKLFFLLNAFYEKAPETHLQHSRWNARKYLSFTSSTGDLIGRMEFFIAELRQYGAFGGIIIDDEPGVIAGGDVNPDTLKRFGGPAPELPLYQAEPSVISEDDQRLRWYIFQEVNKKRFYAGIFEYFRGKYPDIKLATIPAAPYFSGFQLSMPDCSIDAFFAQNRNVTLDMVHVEKYHLYVQYYICPLSGEGCDDTAGVCGLCLGMTKGLPQFCPRPIFASCNGEGKTIAAPALRRYILQTFAEGAAGIDFFPARSLNDDLFKAGAETYERYIKPLSASLPRLRKVSGRCGILCSTATVATGAIWRDNPIERYRHIHYIQSLAYYLFKRGIPFDIVPENEINAMNGIDRYDCLITAGVRDLERKTVRVLDRYVKKGKMLITDKESARIIKCASVSDFDAGEVYRVLVSGTMSPTTLDYQAGMLAGVLNSRLPDSLAPVTSTSLDININYLTDGNDLYILVVNDNLERAIEAELHFPPPLRSVYDVMDNRALGSIEKLRIELQVGMMKVLRVEGENGKGT